MKFVKELDAKYINRDKVVGSIEFPDGLCNVTDPCYEKDTWCALYDVKIKPGMYKALIDEVDFPSIWKAEDNLDAFMHDVNVGDSYEVHDARIMSLTIIHEDYMGSYRYAHYNRYKLSNQIGVDSGMCGFYNYKPDFSSDEDWDNFWKSLNKTEHDNVCDCSRADGVTVSSGFGDGCYTVYKLVKDRKTIGLQLIFN